MLGPTLKGEHVRLEPLRPDDLDLIRGWMADERVTRYLLSRFPFSEAMETEWYDRSAGATDQVAWRLVADERTIGMTGLNHIDWISRGARSGLFIGDTSMWGRGYAGQAVQMRTAFAFGELGLERLESESFVENTGMHRALEKAGYRTFATRRRAVFKGGAWHDLYLFELLREEWDGVQGWSVGSGRCV